jgi:hypothetical protein
LFWDPTNTVTEPNDNVRMATDCPLKRAFEKNQLYRERRGEPRNSLGWSRKVGVVDSGRVLDGDRDAVVARAALAEVVVLAGRSVGMISPPSEVKY